MVYSRIQNTVKINNTPQSLHGEEKRQKRELGYGKLQLKIAKFIINNGISSPFDVENKLEIPKVLSNNTFKKMNNNNSIIKIKTSKRKKYYSLTKKGIKWVLEKGELTDDEFWNLILLINDKKSNKIKFNNKKESKEFSVPELFKQQYPSLEYYKDYFNPFGTDKIFELIKDLINNDTEFLHESIKILKELGLKTKKNINELFKENEKLFMKMYEEGLLYVINDNPKISIFGIIVLLLIFPKKYESELLEQGISKTRTINSIIKKHKNSLPLVFSKWEKLRKVCDNDKKLFETLSGIVLLDFEKIIRLSFKFSELGIIIEQYRIENNYREKLEGILSSGISCLLSWSKKNGFKNCLFDDNFQLRKDFQNDEKYEELEPYLQTIKKLHDLDRMVGYYKWHELGFLEIDKDDSKGELSSIQNIISLYFYTQLRINFYGNSKLQKFLEEDEEICDWWNNWLDVTTEYNKESLKLKSTKRSTKQ